MNQNQRQYALNRITTITALKRKQLIDLHTVKGSRITWQAATELFLDQKIFLNDKLSAADNCSPKNVEDVFDIKALIVMEHISEVGTLALKVLEATSKATQDEIMLGDSEAALTAIRNFEAAI
jgi:hypothetical protein